VYSASPRQLRGAGNRPGNLNVGRLVLRLAYRPPFDLDHLLDYFRVRAVPGIESVAARSLYAVDATGPRAGGGHSAQGAGDFVECRLRLADTRDLGSAVARCPDGSSTSTPTLLRSQQHLRAAGLGESRRASHPGMRSPGHSDPVELALRTVLGQQISLAAARSPISATPRRRGEERRLPSGAAGAAGVDRLFPTAEVIAAAVRRRTVGAAETQGSRTIRALARASLAVGDIDLGAGCDRVGGRIVCFSLCRGSGRGASDTSGCAPSATPTSSSAPISGVKKALTEIDASGVRARGDEEWADVLSAVSPWRSYLTHILWAHHSKTTR
jgi:AraC family transcriptional regulator of adaptative response / DNA-3-methyladenine glycosylase II